MVCPLVEPALRATPEEASAAWWSGAQPSSSALDEIDRKRDARVRPASLPGSLAGEEIYFLFY